MTEQVHTASAARAAQAAPRGAPPTAADAGRDPAWLRRWAALLLALAVLWPVLRLTEFRPWQMLDAHSLQATTSFLASFVPPRHDWAFVWLLAKEAWRTIAIATAGLALAWLIGAPLALMASASLSISASEGAGRMAALPRLLRQLLRWLLVALRSIPELVYALLLVRVTGLGPTAGVLAIAIAYGGMLGKVYAEILESADPAPTQALLRAGCGRLQAFFCGTLPQCAQELAGYTVYRWECAVRSSVVLGFVGAGGLGQLLDSAAKMFAGNEVSATLLVFIGLVWLSDGLSAWLRRRLA
ncbi:ABC transporter permease subunit [Comamonadaceae bacterium OH2310_COT-174]|nr:ABC transporter permease subunit [Comamonadaceae bacterium OH2310_COT-174]